MRRGFRAGDARTAIAVVLLLAPLVAVGGVAGADEGSSSLEADTHPALDPSNNSTVHEDPSVAGESGDLEAVEGYLARTLARRLDQSTVQLSQGEYDVAKRFVGEEYRQRYDQYVDVAGRTDAGGGGGDDGDDGAGERFERAQENQQEYVSSVERYRETHREYREARQNGDETRARELARELERLSSRIDSTGGELRRNYRNVSEQTEQNLSESRRTVRNITRNVTSQQADVREETFVETTLSVRAASSDISFVDPLVVTGTVRDENGTGVANRSTVFQVGEQTLRTETNETGGFELTYRPTTLPANASELSVRYVPANESTYLGSDATVAVNVSQVAPTIRLTETPGRVGFGEPLAVAGTVGANGTGAGGVPVVVSLDGRELATGRTDANGSFVVRTTVPAPIPAGERSLDVVVPLRGQALARANATASVTVRETGTALNVSAASTGDAVVRASGRLTSADGDPVPDQPVEIRVEGETLATVPTDSAGRYETTVTVPPSATTGEERNVNVAAVYAASATNLGPSRVETVVSLPAGASRAESAWGLLVQFVASLPWWVLGAGALALVVAAGVVGRRVVREREESASVGHGDRSRSNSTGANAGETSGDVDRSRFLLDGARAALDRGEPDDAVRSAYAAARAALADEFELAPGSTHWEVLGTCANLDATRRQALEALTRAYERAAFTAGGVEQASASSAIEDATDLVRWSDR